VELEVLQAGPSMGQQLVLLALEAWVASLVEQEVLEVLQADPSPGLRLVALVA